MSDEMPAWAVRLEAKVDVALGQQAQRLDDHGAKIDDHEIRLRAQEAKRYITQSGVWAAVLGASALVSTAATVVTRITGAS